VGCAYLGGWYGDVDGGIAVFVGGGYAASDDGLEVAGGAKVYGVGFSEEEVGFGGEGYCDAFAGHCFHRNHQTLSNPHTSRIR